MVSELFTVYGKTDGSSAEGTFSLTSTLFRGSVNYIRIPKGMKLKIWCKSISGKPAVVNIEYTSDVTAETPEWNPIHTEVLASEGEIEIEKRRPIIVLGKTGKEAVSFTWDQTDFGAGVTYIEFDIEITDE